MHEISQWISTLFDATGFMPRGSCGPWTPGWRMLAIACDAMYGLSYMLIPVFLVKLWRIKRQVYGRVGLTLLFYAGFIFICGTTHLCQVAVWWYPAYRLYTLIAFPGAMLSVVCAGLTPAAWWHFASLKTPGELIPDNERLVAALASERAITLKLGVAIKAGDETVMRLRNLLNEREWGSRQREILTSCISNLDSAMAS